MPIPQLLVSVRNAHEARAALAGGADLIDIKEPAAGPLGMAPPETITDIVCEVDDQRPVSAALGELNAPPALAALPEALRYAKLGLAQAPADWRTRLREHAERLGVHRFIAVAYADHARAGAPPIEDVLAWALEHRVAGLLIDTAIKDGHGLLEWCAPEALRRWIDIVHRYDLLVALAGSLTEAALPRMLPLAPDVIAVRGAACAQRDRDGAVQQTRVRRLKRILAARSAAATSSAG